MADKIEVNFKLPMKGTGFVVVDGVKYAPGVTFDAGTEEARNSLKKRQAAYDVSADVPTIESPTIASIPSAKVAAVAVPTITPDPVPNAQASESFEQVAKENSEKGDVTYEHDRIGGNPGS